jgi:hypothetical protein
MLTRIIAAVLCVLVPFATVSAKEEGRKERETDAGKDF